MRNRNEYMRFIWCLLALLCFVGHGNAKKCKMKCVTLNLRYDNRGDGINKWDNRKDMVLQLIKDENPDVVCFQEVLDRQLKDLEGNQSVYKHMGVGRDDGKTLGEYSPIFYKTDKFIKVEDGTFWLSEHPDSVGSVGWDAKFPRIVTWVILKEKKKGKEFIVINTHFDHVGKKARLQSAELIKRWISENAHHMPVILTGDLNVTEKKDAYKSLTNEDSPLVDSYKICQKKVGADYSFHNFGKMLGLGKAKIDYIFVSKDIKVESVIIPYENPINGVFLSDHNPIIANILIK